MAWVKQAISQLAERRDWGYRPGAPSASEPTALAVLALADHGDRATAERGANWLAQIQNRDGSVGITAQDHTPCWPTSLAVLAWIAVDREAFAKPIARATQWLLRAEGVALDRTSQLGHDSTIIGWPWVLSTHSWLEPTAWALLALRATGNRDNERYREGIRMVIDRLLPIGGANYGNTFVLGQMLRPQLEPTGLAMIALAGERDAAGRIEDSCRYLRKTLDVQTPAVSLSYGLLGLAAQGELPDDYEPWLSAAYQRTAEQGADSLRLALLTLAALGPACSLVRTAIQSASEDANG